MNNKKPNDISDEQSYESILKKCGDNNDIASLWEFFQYKAANAYITPLSLKLDLKLSDSQKETLYSKLLKEAGIAEADFLFSGSLHSQIKIIQSMGLSDTTFSCDRIKGFMNRKNSEKSKSRQLDCLFRHMRNTFAHGRTAFSDSYIILEDKSDKELTARIIITIDVLFLWKTIIENFLLEIQ